MLKISVVFLIKLLATMTTEEIKRKMDRRNIETLVTIQVHQKDVFLRIPDLILKLQELLSFRHLNHL